MTVTNSESSDQASNVRTRFAPSPTGFLHVGGVRTALFAWLIARQNKGQFILRLEDTDRAREVEGSGQHIMDSLRWLGLTWDEGPDIGGSLGPYIQSQRLATYKPWALRLIEAGRAYADPYSAAEVQTFREQAQANKKAFLYRNHRPTNPPKWDGAMPLRFLSEPKSYTWNDEVMGKLHAGAESIDDFILIKSDGYPTYNFAHIVDDAEMKISHVIRSQEFLASVPKYLNLYEALNLTPPKLATLPYVMGPDGTKKLSKRDGAKDILDYAREGYLPEAIVNYLASLGWNDGTEQEIFSLEELLKKFNIHQVQRSGARFDEQRLLWMNGAHIRKSNIDDLMPMSEKFWPTDANEYDSAYKKQVLQLVQDRLKYFAELPKLTNFFFKDLPLDMTLIDNNKQLGHVDHKSSKELLITARNQLQKSNFNQQELVTTLNDLLTDTGQKPAVLFSLIRIAITQAPASPGLADTLALLGKDTSLKRLQLQIDAL